MAGTQWWKLRAPTGENTSSMEIKLTASELKAMLPVDTSTIAFEMHEEKPDSV